MSNMASNTDWLKELEEVPPENNLTWGSKEIDKYCSKPYIGGVTVLAGAAGVGKSSFIWNLAMKNAQNGVKTLLVTLEQSRTQLTRSLLTGALRLDPKYQKGEYMTKAGQLAHEIRQSGMRCEDEESLALEGRVTLGAILDVGEEYDLIIIDSVNAICAGRDEKEKLQNQRVYSADLKKHTRNHGTTVIWTNWTRSRDPQSEMRGAYELIGNCDTEAYLIWAKEDVTHGFNRVFKTEKNRGGLSAEVGYNIKENTDSSPGLLTIKAAPELFT